MQAQSFNLNRESITKLLERNQSILWAKFAGDKSLKISEFHYALLNRIQEGASQGKLDIHLTENQTALHGIIAVEDSAWDSDHFGEQMGRLSVVLYDPELAVDRRVRLLAEVLKRTRYSMISSRVNLIDYKTVQAVERVGGYLTDVLVTFRRSTNDHIDQPIARAVTIRDAKPQDCDALVKMGRTIFTVDRFHSDPRLANHRSDEVYGKWIANSLNGYADKVLVAHQDDIAVGFITCKLENAGGGSLYGVIDLVGVAPEYTGSGIGSSLVSGAVEWFRDHVASVYVGTQGANPSALRLYEKNGFQIVSCEATFHLWS